MKIAEMIDVLSKAELKPNGDYANVEIYDKDFEEWMLCLAPSWDFFRNEYRIKPETKRVPLTMQDLIDRIKEGKTMWIALTDGGICQQITSFSWEYFTTNVGTYNYDQLAEKFTFHDGTPCYKEVESE